MEMGVTFANYVQKTFNITVVLHEGVQLFSYDGLLFDELNLCVFRGHVQLEFSGIGDLRVVRDGRTYDTCTIVRNTDQLTEQEVSPVLCFKSEGFMGRGHGSKLLRQGILYAQEGRRIPGDQLTLQLHHLARYFDLKEQLRLLAIARMRETLMDCFTRHQRQLGKEALPSMLRRVLVNQQQGSINNTDVLRFRTLHSRDNELVLGIVND